ncbi:hypothetical protein V1522DRAFT_233153 [Lipomyces starkeyi]
MATVGSRKLRPLMHQVALIATNRGDELKTKGMSPASAMNPANTLNVPMPATGIQIPTYDGKNFVIWEARVKSYLATMNAATALDDDVSLERMTPKQLHADNIAKGVIIGHVNNLMMLTLTMFERAFDMFDYLRGRYIEKATDRQAELLSNLYSTKMSNSESLQSHLETMLLYRKQLQLGQTEFTDQMFIWVGPAVMSRTSATTPSASIQNI